MTRLLLTRIPFFKEIIVSSFTCDSCSWSNTEIQSAGRIQEQGVRYTLTVTSRQVSGGSPLCPQQRGWYRLCARAAGSCLADALCAPLSLTSWSCLSNKAFIFCAI